MEHRESVQVERITERTHWLLALLRSAKQGRIVSRLGTDLTFGLGPTATCYPGPRHCAALWGSCNCAGRRNDKRSIRRRRTDTVERATQGGGKPDAIADHCSEWAGRGYEGDPDQLHRLRDFIASGDPPANTIDEVGILTTSFIENDIFDWPDGTHHHDRAHVALGNNERRDVVVHGPRHMDGEINKPTISIDGLVIVEGGVFLDKSIPTSNKENPNECHYSG